MATVAVKQIRSSVSSLSRRRTRDNAVDQLPQTVPETCGTTGSCRSLVSSNNRRRLPLRARDCTSQCATEHVLIPNSPVPFEVDNDIVRGKAILKVLTKDPNDVYAPYFQGKKRTFEIQIEVQFKDITENDQVFFGIETDGPIKLDGFLTKIAGKVVLGLISATVPNAHCTLGGSHENGVLTFPLDVAVDRLAVTHHGALPPTMGVQMYPEQYSREKRPPLKSYNPQDTYSLSLHSMYVDLVNFQLVNLLGIGSVSLDTFLNGQPLYFVGYKLSRTHGSGPHLPEEKSYLFKFEVQNDLRKKH